MHAYDVALKRILTRPGSALLQALDRDAPGSAAPGGSAPGSAMEMRWLNVELPEVSNLRVDLLGARPDGGLVQFEFQSRNERDLVYRMAEYKFAVRRRYGRLPRQIVLYVGERPMRMANSVSDRDLRFRFRLVDVRDLDGEALLASKNLSDNVIAILTEARGGTGDGAAYPAADIRGARAKPAGSAGGTVDSGRVAQTGRRTEAGE